MALLQEAIPTLKETTIAFTANSEFQFNRTCQFLSIINLTGEVEVSINDNDYTSARGGITYKMPPDTQIYSMRFRETAGAVANLVIATGNGDIFDNRASFAGNLPVVNAASPDDSLQVDLLAADAGLVALASAVVAGLQASVDLRQRFTSLGGATFAAHVNTVTTVTLVASGSNTGGILVPIARINSYQSDDRAFYGINDGADKPVVGNRGDATTTSILNDAVQNIFIPAGVALVANFENVNCSGYIWYEVL